MTLRFPDSGSRGCRLIVDSAYPQVAMTLLLAFWRLPQLYLVALGVHDPAKLAELRFLGFLQDITSFSTECGRRFRGLRWRVLAGLR